MGNSRLRIQSNRAYSCSTILRILHGARWVSVRICMRFCLRDFLLRYIFCSIDYIPCAENVFVILLYLASFHMPVWCRRVQTVANLCIRVWHTLQTCVREEFNQENMYMYRYIESKYKQHGMRVYMHVGHSDVFVHDAGFVFVLNTFVLINVWVNRREWERR